MHQKNSKNIILEKVHPLWVAMSIQVVVLLLLKYTLPVGWSVGVWLLVQSVLAVFMTVLAGLPRWWWWIQGILPVALYVGVVQTIIPSLWFGVIAVVLMLVFSAVLGDRVPLYFSNRRTHQALVALAARDSVARAIDLGAGMGGVVRALAMAGVESVGVEYAPLLAMVANFWCRLLALGKVYRGDMWQVDLSDVDMVYVFLSPVPMARLWQKAQAEMKSGALFVSNSFPVPEVVPDEVWELSDSRQTQLFIYRMK